MAETSHWVASWTSAQQAISASELYAAADARKPLSQIVQLSLGGERLRLSLSNEFGDKSLKFDSIHVCLLGSTGTGRRCVVTFSGAAGATIRAGETLTSDSLPLPCSALARLRVEVGLGGQVPAWLSGHHGAAPSELSRGSLVDAELGAAGDRFFLTRIDVEAAATAGAVAVVGDCMSAACGGGEPLGLGWSAVLMQRLLESSATASVALVNQAIAGNRLLRPGAGPSVLSRFERDVLALPGIRWVMLVAGINDLRMADDTRADGFPWPGVTTMIAAYKGLVQQARARNVRIFGATMMSYAGSNQFSKRGEEVRRVVNGWIRRSGTFDAVIDFDAATRHCPRSAGLSVRADSGNHLAPSASGHRSMVDAVELSLFLPQK